MHFSTYYSIVEYVYLYRTSSYGSRSGIEKVEKSRQTVPIKTVNEMTIACFFANSEKYIS